MVTYFKVLNINVTFMMRALFKVTVGDDEGIMKRDTLLLQLLNHFKGHATEAHSCQNNQINNEIMKKCHIFEIQSLNYNALVDIKYDIIWTQLENFYFNNSQLSPFFGFLVQTGSHTLLHY